MGVLAEGNHFGPNPGGLRRVNPFQEIKAKFLSLMTSPKGRAIEGAAALAVTATALETINVVGNSGIPQDLGSLFGINTTSQEATTITLTPETQAQIIAELRIPGPHQFQFEDQNGNIITETFYSYGGDLYSPIPTYDPNTGQQNGTLPPAEGDRAVLLRNIPGVTYVISDGQIKLYQNGEQIGYFDPNSPGSAMAIPASDGTIPTGTFVIYDKYQDEFAHDLGQSPNDLQVPQNAFGPFGVFIQGAGNQRPLQNENQADYGGEFGAQLLCLAAQDTPIKVIPAPNA